MEPKFVYDESKGLASVTIYDEPSGTEFVGLAMCSPEDADMQNEYTGLSIALMRAQVKYLKFQKAQIKAEIDVLKHLQSIINQGTKNNPKSRENILLRRQLRFCEEDLAATNNLLARVKENIKTYINEKEDLYVKIRSQRKRSAASAPAIPLKEER